MVDGEGQSRWGDSDLEASVREHMGRSLDSFKNVMEEIDITMTEFQGGLNCIKQLEAERQKVWLAMCGLTVTSLCQAEPLPFLILVGAHVPPPNCKHWYNAWPQPARKRHLYVIRRLRFLLLRCRRVGRCVGLPTSHDAEISLPM